MSLRTWKGRLVVLVAVLGLLGLLAYRALVPGLPFLRGFQGAEPTTFAFTVEEQVALTPTGRRVPLRLYRPNGKVKRAVLVLHGVHTLGYDEPRLTRFARQLVREGFLVATPDLADLKDYDLAPTAVDDIEASALHLLDAPGLRAADLPHKPTIMGISFAGGLGLCAAGRPSLQHRLGACFAFGGHGDLDRVLAYLATGNLPEGGFLAPHLYGQAVVARRMADHLVPAAEVEPLRAALKLFLQERPDDFQRAVNALPEASKQVASLCLHWDAKGMGGLLKPLASAIHTDPRLSPERNARPDCPLFFLHGSEDNVIPPSETQALGRWAMKGGPAQALVTPLIRHVELEDKGQAAKPPLSDTWKLVRMLTEFLRA